MSDWLIVILFTMLSTMAFMTGSWLMDIVIIFTTLLYLLHWHRRNMDNYFKEHGIPSGNSLLLFILGHFGGLLKSQQEMANLSYNSLPGEKFFGFYQWSKVTVLVKDPELIQRIMVKDFSSFHDRTFPSSEDDPFSKNLFNLSGHSWRILRQKLIPTFSTGKLKLMIDQMIKCGDNLIKDIENISDSEEAVDARLFIANFPAQVIASTAFGLDFKRNDPQTGEFLTKISTIFEMSFLQVLRTIVMMASPKLTNLLKLTMFPQETNRYFLNLTKATKAYRKQNNVNRNDYFQLLLRLQETEESGKSMITADKNEEDALINQMEYVPQLSEDVIKSKPFTDEDITAQTFIFLLAGTETVSGALSFILYNIAKNPLIQKRLKEEVRTVLEKHGDWTYEAVRDMTYLDQVIQETQRLYPALSVLIRECTTTYTIPNSNTVIDKGTVILIPVSSIQRDPKYYPSPDVFDPDRFANNNHKPNPTFMPFGDGPRICIAMRFAILELKVCLAKIFSHYSVELNSKTKEPLRFVKKSFFPRPEGGIWVNFKKDSHKSS